MIAYLYPVTITRTRYGGAYEGGAWAAFHNYPDQLPQGWDGDDITAANWWAENSWRAGVGATPEKALDDLTAKYKREQGRL